MRIFNRQRRPHADGPVSAAARRIRIMVVDENPTALDVMGRRLSRLGHDVTLAENGFAALSLLLAQKFDIIIMEMGMRGLSGVAALRKMRASGLLGGTSIMLMTGRNDSAAIVEALDAGADDHISRPFDFDALDARIRHVVDRARHVRELAQHNEALDARIARRAVELGEVRAELEDLQSDRARLVASIQSLHAEIERMNVNAG